MPPLHLRQEFPSLKAFKEALHSWAIEAHFEPRILKSDTGRVRVGCKRDPECPFVVRCNWERRGGREPLARVTVLRERHSCLDGVVNGGLGHQGARVSGPVNGNGNLPPGAGVWDGNVGSMGVGMGQNGNVSGNGGMDGVGMGMPSGMVVRAGDSENGHMIPGARIIEQHNGGGNNVMPIPGQVLPVLPKVQRNSASRLPFLMGILPKLMTITKETTPVEIRDCLMREFGAEVHLQQCRRAKTEILKKGASGDEGSGGGGQGGGLGSDGPVSGNGSGNGSGNVNGGGSNNNSNSNNNNNNNNNNGMPGNNLPPNQVLFPDMNNHSNGPPGNVNVPMSGAPPNQPSTRVEPPMPPNTSRTGNSGSPPQFTLHTAQAIVNPAIPERSDAALMQASTMTGHAVVGEQPIRCPYCINQRWMRSIKDAVEHMSMHVVV
ncbi:hypothetical protein MFRU_028g00340 [Monilinia fructicola]|nr:hypothetical protein MFRU_028g00340 [Monilinia fructicola]